MDILFKWLILFINFFYLNLSYFVDWYEFFINVIFLVSIVIFGLFIVYILYGFVYLFFWNLNFINVFVKGGFKRIFLD